MKARLAILALGWMLVQSTYAQDEWFDAKTIRPCESEHPAFSKLIERLPTLNPERAYIALNEFELKDKDNPSTCFSAQVHGWLSVVEKRLIRLATPEGVLAPHLSWRCAHIDQHSTRCQGVFADDTAIPDTLNVPYPVPKASIFKVQSDIRDAKLVAAYRISLNALRRGRQPQQVSVTKGQMIVQPSPGDILIVVFRTAGPWKYRKAVWYF